MTGYELQKVAVNARENSDIPASGILTLEQFSCFAALETFSLNIVLCIKNRLPLDFLSRRQSQRKLVLSSSLQRKSCIAALQWFDRQSNIWCPSRTCRTGCIQENRFLQIVIYQAIKLSSCSDVPVEDVDSCWQSRPGEAHCPTSSSAPTNKLVLISALNCFKGCRKLHSMFAVTHSHMLYISDLSPVMDQCWQKTGNMQMMSCHAPLPCWPVLYFGCG